MLPLNEIIMTAATQSQPIVTIKPLYLGRAQAAAYLSISESMLESLSARGEAPKPRKLSAGRSAWLVEELEAWGRDRPVSDLLPPKGSGHGRAGKPGPKNPDGQPSA